MTTDIWRAVPGTRWQQRAPESLWDESAGLNVDGNPDPTSTDRRWLWRPENTLAVNARAGTALEALQRDLTEYLRETCVHHWDDEGGYYYIEPTRPDEPKIRQCRWCAHVEDVAVTA